MSKKKELLTPAEEAARAAFYAEYEVALQVMNPHNTLSIETVGDHAKLLEPPAPVLNLAADGMVRARGIGTALCKLWRSILKAVEAAVDTIANAVAVLAKVLVDVLGVLSNAVLGSGPGKLLLLGATAFALWWFMGRGKRRDEERAVNVIVPDATGNNNKDNAYSEKPLTKGQATTARQQSAGWTNSRAASAPKTLTKV